MRSPDAPADIGLRLAAIADGDPAADRGALSRIRRVAGQYRRRLRLRADAPRRRRSRPAARRRVSRPHRAAARRAGQLPAGGRRRGAAAARRSARQRAAAGGRRAGAEGGGAHPAGRAARSRHAAAPDARSPSRWRPASIRSPARCWRDAGGGSARWSWPTAPNRPIRPRSRRRWPARSAAEGLRPLPWTDAARQFQARVALMRRLEPDDGWPDLSDAALTADVVGLAGAAACRHVAARRTGAARPARHPARPAALGPRAAAGCGAAAAARAAGRARRDRLHPAGAGRLGAGAGVLRPGGDAAARRRAACRCSSRCCRRPGGRSPSPPIWPASGAAAGPTCGATCGGATRSTPGRKIRRAAMPEQCVARRILVAAASACHLLLTIGSSRERTRPQ